MESNKFIADIAKIAYFCFVRPYRKVSGAITLTLYNNRLKSAKRRAIRETDITGKPRYVVFSNGKFYVFNRGGMLNLAKVYKKKTGLSTDWRKLYIFETRVKEEAK